MLAILLILPHQDRMPTAMGTFLLPTATCQQGHPEVLTFRISASRAVCHLCQDLASQVSHLSSLQICQPETGMARRTIVVVDLSDAAADHIKPMLVLDHTTAVLEILATAMVDSVHHLAHVAEV